MKSKLKKILILFVLVVIIFIYATLGAAIYFYLHPEYHLGSGESMLPTLAAHTLTVESTDTSNLTYNDLAAFLLEKGDPAYGWRTDIFFEYEDTDKKLLVKRIIALPGDSLKIDGNNIIVNKVRIDQSYLSEESKDWNEDHKYDVNIPELKGYYVLGDNRKVSADSKYFGEIYQESFTAVLERYYEVPAFLFPYLELVIGSR